MKINLTKNKEGYPPYRYKMKTFLIIFILFLLNSMAYAEMSMRRCMLLPVTDSLDGAIAFKVFEDLEEYLKEGSWCYYRSNSDIISVLKNYKKNLHVHLNDPKILKILAGKVRAGSLIKVDIAKEVKGSTVSLLVLGENGEDVYFKEKSHISSDDPSLIASEISKWLDQYEQIIPYDGQIIGVLGDQFTIDIGKASRVRIGDRFEVVRSIRKKKHPLLKEIVEWEQEKIAKGQIFNVSEFQGQGAVKTYVGQKKLRKGDWVKLIKSKPSAVIPKERFPKIGSQDFGKLGEVKIGFSMGDGSVKTLKSGDTREIGGFLYGLDFGAELWATRNYWVGLDVSKRFGSFGEQTGTVSNKDNSNSITDLKVVAGYKYLPIGFFYGPQVDGYLGYGKRTYDMDTNTSEGFGEVSFSGLAIGAKGSAPIIKKVRLGLDFMYMFSPGFDEAVSGYGDANSTSAYEIEANGSWEYSPAMNIGGAVEYTSSKATFDNSGTAEISVKNTSFKVYAIFNY